MGMNAGKLGTGGWDNRLDGVIMEGFILDALIVVSGVVLGYREIQN
jgi:hypothetical protein